MEDIDVNECETPRGYDIMISMYNPFARLLIIVYIRQYTFFTLNFINKNEKNIDVTVNLNSDSSFNYNISVM